MPPSASKDEMQAPRVPTEPVQLADAVLQDGTEWEDALIEGDVECDGEVAHVETVACVLRRVRMTGVRFEGIRCVDTIFEDCELSAATLVDAVFTRVELVRCRMSGLVASSLQARDVRLVGCKVDGANFRASTWERASFEECELAGADFYSSKLASSKLVRCNLVEAEFSKSTMAGTVLRGSNVTAIRGGSALAGTIIGSDQVVPMALSLFATMGIVVDDDSG